MKLDVHDAKILEILQKDARTSLKGLAEEAKLTPPTVSARMKSLEEMGIIAGYHVDIPPDALGQRVMFFVLKAKPADLEEASEALAKISLVREVHLANGGRIIAVAVLRDASDQERLTNEIAGIPTIQEYDNYSVVKSKKSDFNLPELCENALNTSSLRCWLVFRARAPTEFKSEALS